MVTGQVPFEGDTPFSVGLKQKSEAPPAPKQLNSQIPDDLNSLILKCLEKEKLHIETLNAQWVERDSAKRVRLLEEWVAKYPNENLLLNIDRAEISSDF